MTILLLIIISLVVWVICGFIAYNLLYYCADIDDMTTFWLGPIGLIVVIIEAIIKIYRKYNIKKFQKYLLIENWFKNEKNNYKALDKKIRTL